MSVCSTCFDSFACNGVNMTVVGCVAEGEVTIGGKKDDDDDVEEV